MTMAWIDGIKISDRDALIAAGHDVPALASRLVNTFLRQAIARASSTPTCIRATCS
jgi:ubiquinone biosynthesis protein